MRRSVPLVRYMVYHCCCGTASVREIAAQASYSRQKSPASALLHFICFFLRPIYCLRPSFSLPPLNSRNSDPGPHSRLFSPPSSLRLVPCIFIATRFQLFLPSSTRVELCYCLLLATTTVLLSEVLSVSNAEYVGVVSSGTAHFSQLSRCSNHIHLNDQIFGTCKAHIPPFRGSAATHHGNMIPGAWYSLVLLLRVRSLTRFSVSVVVQ